MIHPNAFLQHLQCVLVEGEQERWEELQEISVVVTQVMSDLKFQYISIDDPRRPDEKTSHWTSGGESQLQVNHNVYMKGGGTLHKHVLDLFEERVRSNAAEWHPVVGRITSNLWYCDSTKHPVMSRMQQHSFERDYASDVVKEAAIKIYNAAFIWHWTPDPTREQLILANTALTLGEGIVEYGEKE